MYRRSHHLTLTLVRCCYDCVFEKRLVGIEVTTTQTDYLCITKIAKILDHIFQRQRTQPTPAELEPGNTYTHSLFWALLTRGVRLLLVMTRSFG
jgi:hypothetical protein